MFYVGISEFSAVFSVFFQSLQLLKFMCSRFSSDLESTGIGATACIHGAFVPDSVVDFQRGEA